MREHAASDKPVATAISLEREGVELRRDLALEPQFCGIR